MKSHKFRKFRKSYVFIIVCLVLVVALFFWFDQSLQPALQHVATIRLKQIATQAINQAIVQQIAQTQKFTNLMEWKTGADGEVSGAIFNQQAHARMTSDCIQVVEKTLAKLEQMPQYVPLGMLLDSSIISHFGPSMKLTLMPAGIVQAEMGSEWKEAGINSMMLEIFVSIQTEVKVLVGFDSASTTITSRIPLTYAVFHGKVPQYYMNQKSTQPLVVPPIR